MKKAKLIFGTLICFGYLSCCSQSKISKSNAKVEKGILLYYMNEPYFFPTTDTMFEKMSDTSIVGLKLGRINFNDILQNISHKNDIVIYVKGEGNNIDTVKSKIGILLVKIETKKIKTNLSTDTAAFNFEYKPNTWAFLKYLIRFDTEISAIEPLLSNDIENLNKEINKIKKGN